MESNAFADAFAQDMSQLGEEQIMQLLMGMQGMMAGADGPEGAFDFDEEDDPFADDFLEEDLQALEEDAPLDFASTESAALEAIAVHALRGSCFAPVLLAEAEGAIAGPSREFPSAAAFALAAEALVRAGRTDGCHLESTIPGTLGAALPGALVAASRCIIMIAAYQLSDKALAKVLLRELAAVDRGDAPLDVASFAPLDERTRESVPDIHDLAEAEFAFAEQGDSALRPVLSTFLYTRTKGTGEVLFFIPGLLQQMAGLGHGKSAPTDGGLEGLARMFGQSGAPPPRDMYIHNDHLEQRFDELSD